MNEKKFLLSITGIITLLLITVGLSYAYFSANLTGEEEATTITVTGGTMNIIYNGGPTITAMNIVPKDDPLGVKTFTVTGNNTTDLEMYYQIILIVETNTFSEEALKYKLISTNTNNNGTPAPSINTLTSIGSGSKTISLGVGEFTSPTGGNKVHTYNLKIYFPNAEYNQNIDQGKKFYGYVVIKEYIPVKLVDAILAQDGGASAIEAKDTPDFSQAPSEIYDYETLEYYEYIEGTHTFDYQYFSNDFAIGTGYTFNEETGYFSLTNYTLGNNILSANINQYYMYNNNYESNYVVRIDSISGTMMTMTTTVSIGEYQALNAGDSGLYATEDEYGTSYYYRGVHEYLNNNLIFGGFQWKIVRINGDNSIRIIYNGTESQFNETGKVNISGDNTAISSQEWNKEYANDNKYMGYMYGGANGVASTQRNGSVSTAATYNETSSNAKIQLDAWYQTNIAGKPFENKIVDNLFCNDRQLRDEVEGYEFGPGYGSEGTFYAAADRLFYPNENIKIPTLKCGQKNDRFTKNDTTIGNGALTYPIGLITADEAAMGGLNSDESNPTSYLNTNRSYWTLSPSSSMEVFVFSVYIDGTLYDWQVNSPTGLRPVINLSSNILVSGEGTATNPYRVV